MKNVIALTQDPEIKRCLEKLDSVESFSEHLRITTIASLEEAVTLKFQGKSFNAVLVEPKMMGCPALEAIFLFSELFKNISIVVVSESDHEAKHVLKNGAQDVINSKTITPEGLARSLFFATYRNYFNSVINVRRYTVNKINNLLDIEAKNHIQNMEKSQREKLENTGHEFRTAINLIQGGIDLLADEVKSKKTKRLLEMVRKSSLHLSQLAEVAIEGESDIKDIFELKTLKEALYNFAMPSCENKNLKFIIRTSLLDNFEIDSRYLALKQILINLLNNAIKFTDNGEVGVLIEYDNNNGLLNFTVWDTGVGIKDDEIKNIFKRKYRSSTTTRKKGSGIGLSIVMDLVKSLDGKISAESLVGSGTKVTLSIPQENDTNLMESVRNTSFSSQWKDVLIIEDDKMMISLYKKIFEKRPWKIDYSLTIDEADRLMGDSSYYCVISDLNLNNLTVLKTLNRLKEMIDPKSKLIIVSGASKAKLSELMSINPQIYKTVQKPVVKAELIKLIDLVLKEDIRKAS